MIFRAILSVFWRLLCAAIIIGIILNDSSFDGLLYVLFLVRTILRTLLGQMEYFYRTICPDAYEHYKVLFASWHAKATAYTLVVLHKIMVWVANFTALWVQKSPKYLCKLNEYLAKSGARIVGALPESYQGLTQDWKLIMEASRQFYKKCAAGGFSDGFSE